MRPSESGQAVLEYILILALTVAVMLGAVYQLNDAFRQWAQNYFGEYLACILETGELPSLGGQEGMGAVCDQDFAPFSLASGRPLVGSGGPGAGGAGLSGEGGEGREGQGRVHSGSQAGEGAAGAAGGGGGGGRWAAGRRPPPRAIGGVGGQEGRFAANKRDTGSSDFLGAGQIESGQQEEARRRQRMGQGFGWVEDRKKPEEGQRRAMTPLKKDDGQDLRPQKIKVERRPATAQAEEPEPLTFGYFLRFLLMAALIIAILYFLATQAMQIRNSMDAS